MLESPVAGAQVKVYVGVALVLESTLSVVAIRPHSSKLGVTFTVGLRVPIPVNEAPPNMVSIEVMVVAVAG